MSDLSYYLDKLESVQKDLVMLNEKEKITEDQYTDLQEKLDQTKNAFKESENKGVFFFILWNDWFKKQLILTQIKNSKDV